MSGMLFCFGILLLLGGLAILGYGLFLFYAWLPILFALFGFEVGLLLGRWLSGDTALLAVTLGIVVAIAAAGAAYSFEPHRRVILGSVAGAVLTLSFARVLNLEHLIGGYFGILLIVAGAVLGAAVVTRYFDLLIIAASSLGGATLIVIGVQLMLPPPGDPTQWSTLPALVAAILTAIGIRWQLSNFADWVPAHARHQDIFGSPASHQSRSREP